MCFFGKHAEALGQAASRGRTLRCCQSRSQAPLSSNVRNPANTSLVPRAPAAPAAACRALHAPRGQHHHGGRSSGPWQLPQTEGISRAKGIRFIEHSFSIPVPCRSAPSTLRITHVFQKRPFLIRPPKLLGETRNRKRIALPFSLDYSPLVPCGQPAGSLLIPAGVQAFLTNPCEALSARRGRA